MSALTSERLRYRLHYDAGTDIFTALVAHGRRAIGDQVGSISQAGYWNIWIDYRCYTAHRLAWLYMTGEWPRLNIDHVNGDRADTSWSNLRLATHSQNCANAKGWSRHGLKGINLSGNRWQAQIKCRGVRYVLGSFETAEAAHAAYAEAARRLQGQFARSA